MKISLLILLLSVSYMAVSQSTATEKNTQSSIFLENARQAFETLEKEKRALLSTQVNKPKYTDNNNDILIYPSSLKSENSNIEQKNTSNQHLKNMPMGTTLFEIMHPNSDTAIFHIESEGKSSFVGSVEVDGASTNKAAYDAGSGVIIDFSKSNLAYTSSDATDFTLDGIKDGGTYTLAVQGTMAGLASFTAEGFIFKSKNNGPTQDSSDTLYTFLVIGDTVYYSMTTGL